ncbi:class I transcription factor A, subunit 6 [Trypanosoma equiperdum]|uniref:Uncharacterized protein n=4 Tax=Trypanozoon TaxID=39700 RepID=Q57W42_TRYB2|nr:hypothetical protein, conserved [Trypanosoma brucei gambiense DAL972]XP_844771.1 hypothetical protein, conserved [Trypanosoma brucei brucei TREU927]AAX70177.1 hypothetical protein, conserved [Trypanosoma brucei]RHW72347.1 class I transcription factor A [Trypanosoma brucei equiperdum]SCU64872.1 class I transcription factor A, subunit 6 [Trypanosoma equiperdum]AAZ11212.1 hypothetical protein, conserved [Trypanosoma brucei brucei TREU927]CBH10995.1 hypothetical protein, conserved [Trypanosoma|eukprot:XP_011773282.1 hypothetical protein, conserved [Trypanosoma brucei gambiense DAL972]
MAVQPGKVLAEQFSRQGIQYEESTDVLWCSLCTKADSLEIISRATVEDVLEHCRLRQHLLLMEKETVKEHYCPVEINGRSFLLDHNCVYPSTMFGKGRMLLDDTLGCVMTEDVCGGVKLLPRHKYTVVEIVIPPAGTPIPKDPSYYVERPVRSRKCHEKFDSWIQVHNSSVEGESALMKRRRIAFSQLNM